MPATVQPLQVRHLFRQSSQTVFDHWLAEHKAGRWLFATPQGRMQRVRLEHLHDFKFHVIECHGSQLKVHTGEYHEVQRPRLLLFSCSTSAQQPLVGEPDLVQLKFSPHPLGCELELTHQTSEAWHPFSHQIIEGWTHILTGLMAELNDREFDTGQILN